MVVCGRGSGWLGGWEGVDPLWRWDMLEAWVNSLLAGLTLKRGGIMLCGGS